MSDRFGIMTLFLMLALSAVVGDTSIPRAVVYPLADIIISLRNRVRHIPRMQYYPCNL